MPSAKVQQWYSGSGRPRGRDGLVCGRIPEGAVEGGGVLLVRRDLCAFTCCAPTCGWPTWPGTQRPIEDASPMEPAI